MLTKDIALLTEEYQRLELDVAKVPQLLRRLDESSTEVDTLNHQVRKPALRG